MKLRGRMLMLIACLFCVASQASNALLPLIDDNFTSLEDILNRFGQMKAVLAEEGDAREIFVALLLTTTEYAAEAMEEGFFEDPSWTEAFLLDFNDLYREALLNYELGRVELVPEAWRVAFDAAKDPSVSVFTHSLLGIHAHINHDLAFSVAAVVPRGARGMRYAQFVTTNDFLLGAVDVIEDVAAEYDPALGELDEGLGRFDEWMLDRTLTAWRFEAWRVAAFLEPGETSWRAVVHAMWVEWRSGMQARVIAGR